MSNLIGHTLGRYHIIEQLGEGGMAVVYKAYDMRLERNVAVKVILPQKQHTEKFIKRFEREAKALAHLSHPNIVKVIDYGEHENMPFLVMEYISGGTLKQKLSGKAIPWQDAVRILIPIARALGHAHQQRIIHRDVKASNILITDSGEPMLSDFGIAKILEVEETLDLTGTGVGVGTPEYMSPEQAQGKPVDERSDIYSLGVVFYEMVTGRKPYQADTPMAVAFKLASEPLPSPRNFVASLPVSIEQLLVKALAKDAKNRFQDMHVFAQALNNLESQVSTHLSTKSKRGTTWAWIIPVVIMFAVSTLFGVFKPGSPEQKTQASPTYTILPQPSSSITPTLKSPTIETTLSPPVGIPQAIASYSEDAYYDQFEEASYEGKINSTLWSARTSACTVFQKEGALKFTNNPASSGQECDIFAARPSLLSSAGELGVFEVQAMISSDYNKKNTITQEIQYRTDSIPGGTWWALCGLIVDGGNKLQGFMNISFYSGGASDYTDFYGTVDLDLGFDVWHTIRLEADPQTFQITCQVDGQVIGSIAPSNIEKLMGASFFRVNEAARWKGAFATSYIDNVYFASSLEDQTPSANQTSIPNSSTFTVQAAKLWQDTRVTVKPGDMVTIKYLEGSWRWTGDRANFDGEGDPAATGAYRDICVKKDECPINDAPLSALIGKIGISGPPFLVGNSITFTVPNDYDHDQSIYLIGNDNFNGFFDNVGSIVVEITAQSP